MKAITEAKKKELTKKQRDSRSKFKKSIICFVIAIVLFIGLLVIQTSVLNQEAKTKVYKATSDLVSGTKIDETSFSNYFYESYVSTSELEDGTVTNPSTVYGTLLKRDIFKNEVLTTNKTGEVKSSILHSMDNPVKISFAADELQAAVSGEIREGDLINIYCTSSVKDPITGEAVSVVENVAENVYVQGSYISDGTIVNKTVTKYDENGDNSENVTDGNTATMFSILIPKSFEQEFIMYGTKGSYYISKVLDPGTKTVFGTNTTLSASTYSGAVSENNINSEYIDLSSASIDRVEAEGNGEIKIVLTDRNNSTAVLNLSSDNKCVAELAEMMGSDELDELESLFDRMAEDSSNTVEYVNKFKELAMKYEYQLRASNDESYDTAEDVTKQVSTTHLINDNLTYEEYSFEISDGAYIVLSDGDNTKKISIDSESGIPNIFTDIEEDVKEDFKRQFDLIQTTDDAGDLMDSYCASVITVIKNSGMVVNL